MTLGKMATSVVLTAALSFVAFTTTSAQANKTLTGTVTDQACGAEHKMKGMSPADCARACAKKAGWALVVGDKVYKLQGHDADLDKNAAAKVTVKGTLNGDTMTVDSVTPAKS